MMAETKKAPKRTYTLPDGRKLHVKVEPPKEPKDSEPKDSEPKDEGGWVDA